MTTHLITGGAGFIGANLARRLLGQGDTVLLLDDLSLGCEANLAWIGAGARFARADCADPAAIRAALAGFDAPPPTEIWHLAANSDIAAGTDDLRVDLHRTFMTTAGLLLAMRTLDPARLHFASSSAVYGDQSDKATAEASGPFEPISYYGAMKLASEAQIRAAVESFVPRANVFRFANIIGVPATHGVVFDFLNRLQESPVRLVVRGNGAQRKPYLHVDELIDAMLFVAGYAHASYNVYNIGPDDEGLSVARIAEIVVDAVAPGADIAFGTEPRGWVGDVPRVRLPTAKLAGLGWSARMGSEQAVRQAVSEIVSSRRGGG